MLMKPLSSKIIRIMHPTEVEERLSSGLRSKLKDKEEKKEKKTPAVLSYKARCDLKKKSLELRTKSLSI